MSVAGSAVDSLWLFRGVARSCKLIIQFVGVIIAFSINAGVLTARQK